MVIDKRSLRHCSTDPEKTIDPVADVAEIEHDEVRLSIIKQRVEWFRTYKYKYDYHHLGPKLTWAAITLIEFAVGIVQVQIAVSITTVDITFR